MSNADRLMLIDGALTEGEGGAAGDWIDSHSPATLEPLGRVPNATAGDVDRAVRACAAAVSYTHLTLPTNREV